MDQQPENKPEKDEVKGITDWEKHLKDKEHTDNSLQKQTVPSDEHVVAPAAPSATAPAAPRVHINGEGTSSVLPGHREPGGFWFFVLLIAFCVSALCGMYLSVHPGASCTQNKNSSTVVVKTSGTKNKGTEGIAWIKIRGVISEEDSSSAWSMPTGASYIAKRVREAAKEDKVKAIVLDINSPGGTVASVQDIYSELLKAKEQGKKIVALFRDVAASGAFYIAMAADQIVADPGTITGSVGVIMQAGNVTGLFDKLGIKVEPITSGKYKDIGSAYRPMTDAERALLQDMVNDTYSQFLDVVKTGRPNVKLMDLAQYTDGRVFTGKRAFELGFVDKLGGEETARLLAGELAGLKDPKIISKKREGLRDLIISVGSGMDSKNMSKQLQSISTPRVSYLWTL